MDVADDVDAAESEPTDPHPHQHTPINTTPTLGALDFTEADVDVADDEDAAESEPTDTHPHQHTPINTPPTLGALDFIEADVGVADDEDAAESEPADEARQSLTMLYDDKELKERVSSQQQVGAGQ
eukprot:gene15647-21754_t